MDGRYEKVCKIKDNGIRSLSGDGVHIAVIHLRYNSHFSGVGVRAQEVAEPVCRVLRLLPGSGGGVQEHRLEEVWGGRGEVLRISVGQAEQQAVQEFVQ